MRQHQWTTEEEDILRRDYKQNDNSARSIGLKLGLTRDSVKCKANRMGLSAPNSKRKWTEKEERYLASLIGKYSTSTIAVKMHRSVASIARRAELLKISRRDRSGWFTQQETCEILGVVHRWLQHKINRKELVAFRDGGCWHVDEKDLVTFIRKHAYELKGRNLDPLMFVDLLAGVIS